MRILYDHQIFSAFVFGGVARYFFELMDSYSRDHEITFQLSLQYSDNLYLKDTSWTNGVRPYFQQITGQGLKTLPGRLARNPVAKLVNASRRKANRRNSERLLEQGDYDIFHPTYYDPYFLDHLSNKPFVLTVYDMIHELFPDQFTSSTEISKWKALLTRRAAKIIAISENTKRDLMRLHGLPSERIKVIYLANSLNGDVIAKTSGMDRRIPREPFLLYVGNRAGYKNFRFFVESIVPFLTGDKSLQLVCAGGSTFTLTERKLFRAWGVEKNLHHFFLNDQLLVSLYKNAIAMVFPSMYEGFGIPILEAYACECPVLISNTSSLPEIAGDASLVFDPTNSISIRDAVSEIVSSEALRSKLKAKGKLRERQFSWKRTADATKEVYKGIL